MGDGEALPVDQKVKDVVEIAGAGTGIVTDMAHPTELLLHGLQQVSHIIAGATPVMHTVGNVALPISIAIAVAEVAFSGYSLHKTRKHIKRLNNLLKNLKDKEGVGDDTIEAVKFTIAKKEKKEITKTVGCVPFGGSLLNTVTRIGRAIQKGDEKGVDRCTHAKTLWENHLDGDPLAQQVCQELLGKHWEKIKIQPQGWILLKHKMKSL
jgi:hypothetical protein